MIRRLQIVALVLGGCVADGLPTVDEAEDLAEPDDFAVPDDLARSVDLVVPIDTASSDLSPCKAQEGTFCGSRCVNLEIDSGNCGQCGRECPKSMICVAGQCVCPPCRDDCGGGCIDLQY